jgi:plasmid stability protein
MGIRQGVYLGAYVPIELKRRLKEQAAQAHRTLSQEVIRILTKAVYKKAVPFEEVGKSDEHK